MSTETIQILAGLLATAGVGTFLPWSKILGMLTPSGSPGASTGDMSPMMRFLESTLTGADLSQDIEITVKVGKEATTFTHRRGTTT
jgi:hypothetical protein